MPSSRDWVYGVRTFAASIIALYIAMLMQLPRPYWAMATVYIVSNPLVGPTNAKAFYRIVGTFLGAAAAVFFVPMLVQTPYLLVVAVALWTGTLLFLSLHQRNASSYLFMLAGYTFPLIALPVLNNPLDIWSVAVARTEEVCLGIVAATVVGAIGWPQRLAPIINASAVKLFTEGQIYSQRILTRSLQPDDVGSLRNGMVATFNTLEVMIGQLTHEGVEPNIVRTYKELRSTAIYLLPVLDALDDALYALQHRTPESLRRLTPLLDEIVVWLQSARHGAPLEHWQGLREHIQALRPYAKGLDERNALLFSCALHCLGEWLDLWQDCRSLQWAIECSSQDDWQGVYRQRLGPITSFLDRGLILYSVLSTVSAIIVASAIWILLGWNEGGGAVAMAAVACCFFASMDDPAPQIYRFFLWTALSMLVASLYLFLILPNVTEFPLLVLAFAIPCVCATTLSVQPRFYLGAVLAIINTLAFIGIQGAYQADFMSFANAHLAGPVGVLFAYVWTRIVRPFGADQVARRWTRFNWGDITRLSKPATPPEYQYMGGQMLDRLMQHLPRLALTGQDTANALREMRIALNLLDLLACSPMRPGWPQLLVNQVVEGLGSYFTACLNADRRLPVPGGLLMSLDRASHALNCPRPGEDLQRRQLYALSALRLALLPCVKVTGGTLLDVPLPHGIEGAP